MLIETGMAKERLQEAIERVLEISRPNLIISMGFAGSLHRDFDVAKVLVGDHFVHRSRASDAAAGEGRRPGLSRELLRFCKFHEIGVARVITVDRPEPKALLAHRFVDAPSVMDMESYFVLERSTAEGIPFVGLRAVSDGVTDEIDFELEAICDSKGTVRISKVMLAAIRDPVLVRSFFRSWRRSCSAAGQLADVLVKLLSLPESELEQMVLSSGFESARL